MCQIKAAGETERSRIMEEAAQSAGVSNDPAPTETASDKAKQLELEQAEAKQAAAQVRF